MELRQDAGGEEYGIIALKLRSPHGKLVDGRVVVKDGSAISTFSDKKLAQQLAVAEENVGYDIIYDKKLNAMIQRFPGMKAREIAMIIECEIRKAGGTTKDETQ